MECDENRRFSAPAAHTAKLVRTLHSLHDLFLPKVRFLSVFTCVHPWPHRGFRHIPISGIVVLGARALREPLNMTRANGKQPMTRRGSFPFSLFLFSTLTCNRPSRYQNLANSHKTKDCEHAESAPSPHRCEASFASGRERQASLHEARM